MAAVVAMLNGCNTCNGLMWDFANWDIEVTLIDAAGNNLLDPDFAGNILGNTITATTEGKTYMLNGDIRNEPDRGAANVAPAMRTAEAATRTDKASATRATHADWRGFRTSDEHVALLGEFTTGHIDRQQVVIDWGDGTTSTLWFSLKVTGSNCDPHVNRILWLKTDDSPNGKVVNGKGLAVTITR